MEPEVFDTIIIGAGPAGMTAAIYAVRKSLKVLLISKDIGGQATLSSDIENYPGFSMVSGADLMTKFKSEIDQFEDGLWVNDGETVAKVSGSEGNFLVTTDQSDYSGKTIILASGRIPRMLGVMGETELFGKGIATCATCDAPLYKNKAVAVVGGGNSALDAAYSLLKVASQVTIINNTDNLRGDSLLLKNVTESPNTKVLNSHEVVSIEGTGKVTGITVRSKLTEEVVTISVEGVFIEIGWTPSTDFIETIKKNDKGEIVVDEFGKTSVDGIWAAGDVNNLWGEQIVIAAGEGAKIALAVAEHIAKIPHQTTSNPHESA